MRRLWFGVLGATLSLGTVGAWADEPVWRAVNHGAAAPYQPAATLGRPVPAASLARPVPAVDLGSQDSVQPAEFLNNSRSNPPATLVADPSMPLLAPIGPPSGAGPTNRS